MVDKFKAMLSTIVKEKGEVSFFGILKMDELLEKWTVLLSAPWSSEATKKEDFEYIRNLIIKTLNSEEISSIARLGILSKDSHLIQLLLKYHPGTDITSDTKLNGNVIHAGSIIASNPSL